jgi:hypothetical protein
VLRKLAAGQPTVLNEEDLAEPQSLLRDGDRIKAGRTVFLVRIEGAAESERRPAPGAADGTGAGGAASGASGFALVPIARASDVCGTYDLNEEAAAQLQDGMTPRAFFEALVAQELFPEAIRFLAYALPKREAVFWAILCAEQSLGGSPIDTDVRALHAARDWTGDPTEEHRRAAEEAAYATNLATASGCAAVGAYFSEGSLAPAGLPEVPPQPHMTAEAVSGAVMLAAVAGDPAEILDRQRAFLATGSDVADGVLRVDEASA